MARSLGGVLLPDSMEWLGRHDWRGVAQGRARTLGGGLVVWEQTLSRGREIRLAAREEVTWLSEATVAALVALFATAGATALLDWDGDVYTVALVDHQFERVWPHYDEHTGTIDLITV